MKIRQISGWWLLVLINAFMLFGCSHSQRKIDLDMPPIETEDIMDQDEYDVLSYVITNELVYAEGPKSEIEAFTGIDEVSKDSIKIVIERYTQSDDCSFEYIKSLNSAVDRTTYDDFMGKNKIRCELKERFIFDFKYVLYSLNQDEDWSWDGFYESFPKYVGLTRVSRVGFNEDRTQALLYIGRQTHWLSGLGVVYFLVRAAGQWNIETRITVWIS